MLWQFPLGKCFPAITFLQFPFSICIAVLHFYQSSSTLSPLLQSVTTSSFPHFLLLFFCLFSSLSITLFLIHFIFFSSFILSYSFIFCLSSWFSNIYFLILQFFCSLFIIHFSYLFFFFLVSSPFSNIPSPFFFFIVNFPCFSFGSSSFWNGLWNAETKSYPHAYETLVPLLHTPHDNGLSKPSRVSRVYADIQRRDICRLFVDSRKLCNPLCSAHVYGVYRAFQELMFVSVFLWSTSDRLAPSAVTASSCLFCLMTDHCYLTHRALHFAQETLRKGFRWADLLI
jgi:hypothetical protein